MKKLVTIMMAMAILFAVATSAFAEKSVAGKKIGFVNAGPDDYYAQFGKTLVAVAKSYGMSVTELNSNYKPEQELANVQDLIATGVDAIAVITAGAAGVFSPVTGSKNVTA